MTDQAGENVTGILSSAVVLSQRGSCGTGLSETTRAVIYEELKATQRKTCPFRSVPDVRDEFRQLPDTSPQLVRPTLVVEVEYRRRLRDVLRHVLDIPHERKATGLKFSRHDGNLPGGRPCPYSSLPESLCRGWGTDNSCSHLPSLLVRGS